MKKILITGHRGYIGSRLLQHLIKNEERGTEIHGIDLKDGNDVMTAPLPVDIDVVYHLAAQAGAIPSMHNPIWDAHANILGSIRVASFYAKQAKKIVFVTSAAATDPKSPYGLSKKTAEGYFDMMTDNTVMLRLSSIFGDKPVGVVDSFIRAKECVVYGDGSALRDFVHVDDIIQGLVLAQNWDPGKYEMGTEKGTTIKEIAEATGKSIIYKDARPGELHSSILRNTTPNWKPTIDVIDYVRSKH